MLFSALSANLLGDLRDLSLCFPKPDQNPKTQRPPRTPAEFAEKSYLTISLMLTIQVLVNIAMVLGMMPVVGIPLPLLSYGGSSLLVTMMGLGLLLNIDMRRFMY